MRPDDAQVETANQWLEHSEAWRYAHLDQAPSDYFRRMAILEHERLLLGAEPAPARTPRNYWPRRHRERGRSSTS
jgi:hypothetical protein